MAWILAHNLASRSSEVKLVFPGITIFSIGDPAHQAEASDHNVDACGVVHAIDIMTLSYQSAQHLTEAQCAGRILAWLLLDTTDLQYVIHNKVIYGVDEPNGWKGSPYGGTDPHTDHIHVSGKHGTACENTATGTGYDLAAQKLTPEGIMPTADEIAAAVWASKIKNTVTGTSVPASTFMTSINGEVHTTKLAVTDTSDPSTLIARIASAVVAELPPSVTGGLTEEQVVALITDAINSTHLTVAPEPPAPVVTP